MNPDFENFWDWSTIKIQNNQTIKTRVLLLMKQESIHNPKNLSEMMFYTFYTCEFMQFDILLARILPGFWRTLRI